MSEKVAMLVEKSDLWTDIWMGELKVDAMVAGWALAMVVRKDLKVLLMAEWMVYMTVPMMAVKKGLMTEAMKDFSLVVM